MTAAGRWTRYAPESVLHPRLCPQEARYLEIAAAEQMGAVVGFDDANWATALRPPLTVVTQPTYEIGQAAVDLLLRRIQGEKFAPRRLVLQAKLVERESSRRQPRAAE